MTHFVAYDRTVPPVYLPDWLAAILDRLREFRAWKRVAKGLSLAALPAALLLAPLRPAAAQAEASLSMRVSSDQMSAGASLRPEASVADARPVMMVDDNYHHGTRKEGIALMIVGAAGIVTGLLIDESVVTVLGAVAGGVGLYLYLR
jgi:hypothetical protein